MDDFDMAGRLRFALEALDEVGGLPGGKHDLSMVDRNAAFSEFTVTVGGERFAVTVRELEAREPD